MSKNRLALITGASSGLGVALAENLAARGYDLVLTARSEAPMVALAARLQAAKAVTVTVEVSDLSEPDAAAKLVARLDEKNLVPDVVIANAGFGLKQGFADHDPARLSAMLRLDVISLAELSQLYAARMKAARRGHLLLVSSIAAFQPIPNLAAYSAAKAFVLSLGEALHLELAPHVGVTVLNPGYMETGFGGVAGFKPDAMTRRMALTPAQVAQIGLNAMFRGKPSIVAGRINHAMVALTKYVPRMMAARIAYKMLEKGEQEK